MPEGLVTAMTGAVNTNTMFSNLTDLIPVVGAVVIFAFTYRMIKKILKGGSKGKVNL